MFFRCLNILLHFTCPERIDLHTAGRRQRRGNNSLLDNGEPGASDDHAGSISERIQRRREERRGRDAGRADWESPQASAGADAAEWEASEWGPADGASLEPDEDLGWAAENWAEPPADRYQSNSDVRASDGGEGWDSKYDRRSRAQRRWNGAAASSSGDVSDDVDKIDDDERGFRSGRFEPGVGEPDIALLSPDELERVLPVVPFSDQASFFSGGAATAVQRWGASLALTVLLSKVALLAAGTLTWPLWWPWAQAASKNYSVRKQKQYAGLWRTQVLDIEARGRPRAQFGAGPDGDASPGPSRFSTMRTTKIVLGDEGGAQTELVLPHDARFSLVEPGQPAELIVLSDTPEFESFKAVKDVYLPDCGLWLSEYPFLDRTEFLDLSLEIEREAAVAKGDPVDADAEGYSYENGDGDGYYDPPPRAPRY